MLRAAVPLLAIELAAAHTRLECPPPRSKETGAKTGPCDAPDNPNLKPYPLHPGFNTVTWLEALGHPGAPARFALSLDGSDMGFESCVLLDHVPHDENSRPSLSDESSYHRSSITLWLPDVKCDRCNLQLITYMTDDIHGLPNGKTCVSPRAKVQGRVNNSFEDCKVIYHSCAPVSIGGTVPRADHTCNLTEHNKQLGWPFMEGKPPMSTYLFKGDPGLYSKDRSQLVSGGSPIADCNNYFYCDPNAHYKKVFNVPANATYVSLQGTCAAVVNMKVEPFVLGQTPSTPKPVTSTNPVTPPTSGPKNHISSSALAGPRIGALMTVAVVGLLLSTPV